ncbi:NrfD/PsrC family molybdoenzyme membrane anchor subunit [Chloroflexota bacterium]
MTVVILAFLALSGFVSFIISYIQGHQMFGSSNTIPWGMPIVMTIYLIGLSAGLHILAFFIYIMHQERYREVIRAAVFMAVVLIFGAMVFIALDLGRPEKFWRLFMLFYMNNMASMFAINAIFYSSYLLSAVIYLVSLLNNMKRFSMIMGMIAFGWAMLTHGGTGAIFGFISARETWLSPLSPFEFIFAALTSSLALLIIVLVIIYKVTGRELSRELISSLGGLVKGLLLGMLLLMVIGELTHIYSPDRDAVMYMLTGPFSWLFWVFLIGMGVIVPLVILFHPRAKKSVLGIVIASVLIVIGVFVKRYYLVIPGAAYPLHYYPGKIEGVWGALGSFTFAPAEIILSVGIVAFLGLLFILGLKYLELLPAVEKPKETPKLAEEATDGSKETLEPGDEAAAESKETSEPAVDSIAESES